MPIGQGPDDAEQMFNGQMQLASNDLDFNSSHTIGLRFDVCVPVGVQIVDATLTFTADEPDVLATSALIWGELSGDALPFADQEIIARPRTVASAEWTDIAPWARGDADVSPDLSSVITEIVTSPDWTGCGNVVFIIEGTGDREAVAYEQDPAGAPVLEITYQP